MPDKEVTELNKILAGENPDKIENMDSDLGISRYIKNADQIKNYLKAGKILDWGCGLGQMSYLLKNRGFDVVSYDIETTGHDFLVRIGQSLVLADDPVKLPFPDAFFDAVLSSGVLEHVPDQVASLKEVSRILKTNGYFFIFRLPNKYSYIEFLSDRLGRGDHPVKYSLPEIKAVLERSGYDILQASYKSYVPHNLKGFPAPVRRIYHRFDALLERIDDFFAAFPIINGLSTNLELVARKR